MAWPVRSSNSSGTGTSSTKGIRIVHKGGLPAFRPDATKAEEDALFRAALARNTQDTDLPAQDTGDAASRKRVQELEAKCKAQAKALQESKSMCQRMAAQVQQHEAHKVAMEGRCKDLEAREAALRRKQEREQKRAAKVEEEHGLQLDGLRAEKEGYRKALLEANQDKANALTRLAELEAEASTTQQHLVQEAAALAEALAALRATQASLEAANKELAVLRVALDRLAAEKEAAANAVLEEQQRRNSSNGFGQAFYQCWP